jgi:hypothetical protein
VRQAILALAVLLVPAGLRAEFHALWPLDGRLAAVDSQVPGRSAEENLKSSGADLDLHFSPILGWSGSRWLLLPALDLESSSANTILKVGDERYEFLSQATTNLELAAAFKRTADQRFTVKAFGGGFQAKETADEELATGQYNYQDGGLALDWRQKWDTSAPFRSTVGLRFTDRNYPNWQSLDPEQRREKDQGIAKIYTDLEWALDWMDATPAVGLSLQSIEYKAAIVVDESGTTTAATKRKEAVVDLTLSLPLRHGAHVFAPNLRGELWGSNLNVYDSQNNAYIPGYNSFYELGGGFGYSYDFKGPWCWGAFDSPQVTLDLDLGLRHYISRPAAASDGSLLAEVQQDFTRDVALGFNSAVTQHWAFYTKFNHNASASNNQNQSSALYNFVFNTFSLGFNFVY